MGFWTSELTHAYDAFVKKGYEVIVASPDGGKVEVDALSDPRDASGYSKDDTVSLAYLAKPGFVALLANTPRVDIEDPAGRPRQGPGAVWTTVFPANVDAVRRLLGLPDAVVPFSSVPVGRPAASMPRTKSRFDETKVHRQAWGGR